MLITPHRFDDTSPDGVPPGVSTDAAQLHEAVRIAVWNTAFLGDAVLTLPLVYRLRAAFPRAQLDLYVRRGLGELFAAQPVFHRVVEVGRDEHTLPGLYRLLRQVAQCRYSVWVSAHLSPRSSIVALASGAPVRVGYSGAWHRRLAYTHVTPRRFSELDEVDRLLELLRPLHLASSEGADGSAGMPDISGAAMSGGFVADPSVAPVLTVPAAVSAQAAEFWNTLPPGPVLGMHPGSVWGTKRWSAAGFAAIARQAVTAGAVVLVFAGADEKAMADEVIQRAELEGNPRVRNVAGQLNLLQLTAWLARVHCYLTNDSGPMHLAWLQQVPVVALFGPTVRELGFFPRGPRTVVLEVEPREALSCRPCGLHGPQLCPRGDHACMERITPERVWAAVSQQLFGA